MTSTLHPNRNRAPRERRSTARTYRSPISTSASLEFWERDDDLRDGAFATLRRESPITFFDVADFPGFPAGAGHWALTRFDDIHHASRHPEIFSSIPTSTSLNDVPPEIAEFSGSMINLDDPRHLRLRTIVNRAFTPKVVARIEGSVRDRARTIVTNMVANHHDAQADFVAEASGLLPLQVICDMMGIPEEDEAKVFHWTNVMLGFGDEEVSGEFADVVAVVAEIVDYAMRLAEERRANPGDDLTTSLVQAEVDGERLTSVEIASFFILLSAAGNETTRNAISHGMVALTRYPEEREKWWSDFDGLASHGGRGDRPMGVPGHLHAAQPDSGRRDARHRDEGGGQGFHVVQLRQPRRGQVRQSVVFRRGPGSQPADGVWWRRCALLPGCEPGAPGNSGAVRRTSSPDTRHRRRGGAVASALRVPARHQAVTGRLVFACLSTGACVAVHRIASAIAIWPSKPSDVAIAR